MTPAVALTSQSLDPVQAFAEGEVDLATATISINGVEATSGTTAATTYTGAVPVVSVAGVDGGYTPKIVEQGQTTVVTTALQAGKTYTLTVDVDSSTSPATVTGTATITVTVAKADPVPSFGDVALTNPVALDATTALAFLNGKLAVAGVGDDTDIKSDCTLSITSVSPAADQNPTSQTVTYGLAVANNDNYNSLTGKTVSVGIVPAAKTNIGTLNLVVKDSKGNVITPGTSAKVKVPSSKTPAAAAATAVGDFADGLVVTTADGTAVTCDAVAQNGVITLTGTGDYTGSVSNYSYAVEYTFGSANVESDYSSPYTFNAKSQTPKLTVYNPETGAVATSGYTVKYQQTVNGVTTTVAAPTNAGSYQAVVTWDGYPATETATVDFTINPAALANTYVTISDPSNLTWTGNVLTVPDVTVTANWGTKQNPNNVTLVKDVDYTVTLMKMGATDQDPATSVDPKTFKEVGTYYLQIAGKQGSNYTTANSLDSKTFKVQGASLATATIAVKDPTKLLIEKAGTPVTITANDLVVTLAGKTLTAGTDFAFADVTVNAPTANVPIKITPGTNNNYSGSAQTTVNVLGSVALCDVTAIPPQEYGAAGSKTPAIELTYTDESGNTTVLTEGVDYKVTYGANTGAGSEAGTYTVTGIGNGWGGTFTKHYAINGTDAEIRNVVIKKATYNGTVQNPADFITFDVYADTDDNAATPMTKVDPSDYTYTITTNREFKDAGSYTYTINLADCPYNVDGTNSNSITIAQADLAELTVKPAQESYLITNGKNGALPIEPKFIVTLNGAEYELTSNDVSFGYKNAGGTTIAAGDLNQAAGEITATLTGLPSGNFQNESVVTFDIYNNIANLFPVDVPAVTYNGQEQTPAITLLTEKLAVIPEINGTGNNTTTNYTVAYENNINAGTGKIIVTGTPNAPYAYAGTLEIPFTINKAAATIAVADIADVTYTGSAIQPEPKATITAGTQTVASTFAYSYANNVNAGTATVTVVPTGVGANYDVAATTKTFKINAANMSAVAYAGDTKVAVNKQPTIKLTYNGKELVAGTDYDVTETPVTSKAGKATLKVTGKGNFTGVKTIEITVEDASTPVNPDKPTTTEGWKHNATGWWYETGEGSYVTSAWKQINGNWYYFNKSGYMMTGWQKINGTWYYLNKKGEGTEGAMVSNAWKKINGTWYHFAKSGAMQTGWQKINGAWYYMAASGAMQTGWVKDGNTWYYLLTAAEGTEGKMVSNQWKQINGSWFYFYASGAMAANTWVGNYWVDANGYWVR